VSSSPTDPTAGPGRRAEGSPAPPGPPEGLVSRLRAVGCVFAEEEAELLLAAAPDPGALAALVERRVAGEPLERLLGWVDFCGVRLELDPGVFVPRQRTRVLVDRALPVLRSARAQGRRPVLVDLCCGCGAVGVALATLVGPVEVHAVDLDAAAVRCARRNVSRIGGQVHQGDLFAPLPQRLAGGVDVVVANAPYVPTQEIRFMPPEARLYEPSIALDGGQDGLDVARRIVAGVRDWLTPTGALLVETGRRQVEALLAAAARAGLVAEVVTADEVDGIAVLAHLRGRRDATPG